MVGGQPEQISNAQVIGVAGGVAAALAALMVVRERTRRNGRIRNDAAPEQLHHGLDVVWHAGKEAGRRASVELAEARERAMGGEPILGPLKESADAALQAGRKRSKRVSRKVAAQDPGKLATQAVAAIAQGGAPLQKRTRDLAEQGLQRGQEVAERAGEASHRIGKQAATIAHTVKDQAEEVAGPGLDRVLEVGESLAETARDRAPMVAHKVSDEVVPTLRGLAAVGGRRGAELWDVARERAAAAAEAAQHDGFPQARHVIDLGSERAKAASAGIAKRTDRVPTRMKGAAPRKGGATVRAMDASRHAAEATVETGRDTGALLVWAGLAAALIYYGLMSPERREQVANAVRAVLTETRELVRDIQGYDEEF